MTSEDVKVEAPPILVSTTPAFMWSKQVADGQKQVFNKVACDSGSRSDRSLTSSTGHRT